MMNRLSEKDTKHLLWGTTIIGVEFALAVTAIALTDYYVALRQLIGA